MKDDYDIRYLLIELAIIFGSLIIAGLISTHYNSTIQKSRPESQHSGKCLEYKTEYKLDCGLFVSERNLCKERAYNTCVRWEDNNIDNN